jgi:hypothetical protein
MPKKRGAYPKSGARIVGLPSPISLFLCDFESLSLRATIFLYIHQHQDTL